MNEYYKCRLCLGESRRKVDIFKEEFPQMIEILAGLKVNPNDGLPTTSCLQCYRDVKTAMLTRYQIINSHKILLDLNSPYYKTPNDNVNNTVKNEAPSSSNDGFENVTNTTIENYDEMGKNSTIEDVEDNVILYSSFDDDFNDSSCESYPQFAEVCIKDDPEQDNDTDESRNHIINENCNDRLDTTNADNLIANAEHIIRAVNSNPSSETERTFKELIKMLQSKEGRAGKLYKPINQIKPCSDTKKKKQKIAKTTANKRQVKTKRAQKKTEGMFRANVNYDLKPEHVEFLKSVGKHVRAKCPVCSKEILGGSLKNHLITHTYDPTPCHLCGKISKNAQSLQDHINYYHKITGEGVICDQCGKCFKVPCFLEKHKQRQHQGMEKSLECHVCGKRFYEKKREPMTNLTPDSFVSPKSSSENRDTVSTIITPIPPKSIENGSSCTPKSY